MKRDDPVVMGNRAAQLWGNPMLRAAFDLERERLISQIERLPLNGTNDAQAIALVRDLQSALNFKRNLKSIIVAGDAEQKKRALEEEENKLFDPHAPEKAGEPFDPSAPPTKKKAVRKRKTKAKPNRGKRT